MSDIYSTKARAFWLVTAMPHPGQLGNFIRIGEYNLAHDESCAKWRPYEMQASVFPRWCRCLPAVRQEGSDADRQ